MKHECTNTRIAAGSARVSRSSQRRKGEHAPAASHPLAYANVSVQRHGLDLISSRCGFVRTRLGRLTPATRKMSDGPGLAPFISLHLRGMLGSCRILYYIHQDAWLRSVRLRTSMLLFADPSPIMGERAAVQGLSHVTLGPGWLISSCPSGIAPVKSRRSSQPAVI